MSAYVWTTKLLALFDVIQKYKTNHFREIWHVGNYLFQPMYKCTANIRCLHLLCLGTELRDFNSCLKLFIEVLDFSLYFVKKISLKLKPISLAYYWIFSHGFLQNFWTGFYPTFSALILKSGILKYTQFISAFDP